MPTERPGTEGVAPAGGVWGRNVKDEASLRRWSSAELLSGFLSRAVDVGLNHRTAASLATRVDLPGSTWTFWPTLRTSSTLSIRLPPDQLQHLGDVQQGPSLPGVREMNAPNVVVLTTPRTARRPRASGGSRIALIAYRGLGRRAVDRADVPAVLDGLSAPVSSLIWLIILPFGPMTSPILSTGPSPDDPRGERRLLSGTSMASAMTVEVWSRASRAWVTAPART